MKKQTLRKILILFTVLLLCQESKADPLTLYEKNNAKIETGATLVVGGFFGDQNTYGAGSSDTNNPDTRRTRSKWVETSIEPYLQGVLKNANSSSQYFKYSFVAAHTNGEGDISAASTTSNRPFYIDHEESYLGWRSGKTLSLGEDAIDFSFGNERFNIGDGMLVSLGTTSGLKRASFYTGPRGAFRKAAILRMNTEPVRGQIFHLANHVHQQKMKGNDQPETRLYGGNVEWFRAEKKEKEDEKAEDTWVVGGTILHIYKSDNSYQATPAFTRREGMNVYNIRAGGSFFERNKDIKLAGGYVHQQNGAEARRLSANAYYIEPGYQFSKLWAKPQLSYAYIYYSGDGAPGSSRKKSFDPLFGGYIVNDTFGQWEMGEIYGQFYQINTNSKVNRIHLQIFPTEKTSYGALFYHINFDKPGQAQSISNRAVNEYNVYAKWRPTSWLSLSALIGASVPRQGLKESLRNSLPQVDPNRIGKTTYFGYITAVMSW